MSKRIFKSAMGLAAYMLTAPLFAAGPGVRVVGIEELRQMCRTHENHEQLKPGTVQFQCRKEVEFWVGTGIKNINLPNSGSLCIQAYIKDQRHNTDPWNTAYGVPEQSGKCEEYEQWKAITQFSEPGSCDLVDKIAQIGEDAYCEARMGEEGLTSELNGTIQKIQQDPSHMNEIQAGSIISVLERTGKLRKCEKSCPAPTTTTTSAGSSATSTTECTTNKFTSSSESSSSYRGNAPGFQAHAAADTSSVSSSDVVAGHAVVSNSHTLLGCNVQVVRGKKGYWSQNHQMVEIMDEPQEGSAMARLGMQKGDGISKINGHRVETPEELVSAIRQAKGNKVVVKYVRNGQYVTNTTMIF